MTLPARQPLQTPGMMGRRSRHRPATRLRAPAHAVGRVYEQCRIGPCAQGWAF